MPEAPDDSISRLFERQAARTPEAVAVEADFGILTYNELNRTVNRLARAIRSQAVPQNAPVGFLLEDGVEQIIAVLALFKAGRIAVPLDPHYPSARLKAMIDDSGCRMLVNSRATAALRDELAPDLISLDIAATDGFDDANPERRVDAKAFANIYYTSGTTGEPKGVIQTQENVLRFVMEMARNWKVTPADRFIQLISCSFSAVLLPVLVPLLNGALVVPYDLKREGPGRLGAELATRAISVLFCVPSVFRAIRSAPDQDFSSGALRLCVFTGEPLYWSDVALVRRWFGPGCGAINLFGGSEMHHVASLWIDPATDRGEDIVPAGNPAPGKEILLVDERGEPVAEGEIGELLVRSQFLSPGYWRRTDLTNDAFIEADGATGIRGYRSRDLGRFNADGMLELLGRADSRVKLRGQMVETGAVESAIAACPGVTEAAVCLVPGTGNGERLIAFVATGKLEPMTWSNLKERLSKRLPAFMVPSSFMHVPELPRGPGGKIERASLVKSFPHLRPSSRKYLSPRSDVEQRITAAVELVLGQHPIGVRDDLFDLGLDSLRYVDLHVALEKELGYSLPDDIFVRARTVEALAESGTDISLVGRTHALPGGGQQYGKSWSRLKTEMKVRFFVACMVRQLLPYPWAFAGLAWMSRLSTFQRAWPVRRHVKLIHEFLNAIETESDRHEAVARSLCCNYAQPWLLGAMGRAYRRGSNGEIIVEGLGHFDRAAEAGRGVILAVSHFGIPHADLLVLERAGRQDVVTLGSFEYELRLMDLDHLPHMPLAVESVDNFLFRANLLRRAREALGEGRVVRMAADGLHGSGGKTWRFHGRYRRFRPGIAELALDTGATVIPVFGALQKNSHVKVEFMPALERPDSRLSRQEAIDTYLEQYIRLLEQRWSLDPGSVVWEGAREHLGSPPVYRQ